MNFVFKWVFVVYYFILAIITDTNKNFLQMKPLNILARSVRLDDSDLVGDVKSVVVTSQSDVSLLLAVWSDEAVYLCDFDIVELANSSTNVIFVSSNMNLEYQSVVVLDFLHRSFSGQRIFDDVERIHAISGWDCFSRVFGIAGQSQGSWSSETNGGTNFTQTSSEWSLDSL
jgi:hypothetical protein